MKTVTLKLDLFAKVPKGNSYGTISFLDKKYLAMATGAGPKKGKYSQEDARTQRGGILVGDFELFPVNKLQDRLKQISLGGVWNREWGLFDTNPVFAELMAYVKEVKDSNLAETAGDRKKALEEIQADLAEIMTVEAQVAVGEAKLDGEELAEMAAEKLELLANQSNLFSVEGSYQPKIEIIVE